MLCVGAKLLADCNLVYTSLHATQSDNEQWDCNAAAIPLHELGLQERTEEKGQVHALAVIWI